MLLLLVCVAAIVAVPLWHRASPQPPARPLAQPLARGAVGLFGTLPILWSETERLADLLASGPARHWAVPVLAERGAVRPIDMLADTGDGDPLRGVGLLIMAQPRPLSPRENVALDAWVRRGGRVLLFADPMLTRASAFPLGDKRRPQDVVLLSPILSRWGLRLEFDEAQPAGERQAELLGARLPVDLPGRFAGLPGSRCAIGAGGLLARCAVGAGRVVAVADAAVLDERADDAPPAKVLRRLLTAAIEGT